jgi:hypothetical protein
MPIREIIVARKRARLRFIAKKYSRGIHNG